MLMMCRVNCARSAYVGHFAVVEVVVVLLISAVSALALSLSHTVYSFQRNVEVNFEDDPLLQRYAVDALEVLRHWAEECRHHWHGCRAEMNWWSLPTGY